MGSRQKETRLVTYRIELTLIALESLSAVTDTRVRQLIRDRIDGLVHEPEKQGKPLTRELDGLRSLRAVGQRYRVLFKVERSKITVLILTVGLRKEGDKKDIYALAKKLVRLRLI